MLRQGTLEEKWNKIAQLKEAVSKNLFFLLYVTYLSTCSKTATVLPLECRELCQDVREDICAKYVKSGYSIRCDDHRYKNLVIAAFLSTIYVLALPFAAFVALWKQRRTIIHADNCETPYSPSSNGEIIKAMHFLYENYKASSWYCLVKSSLHLGSSLWDKKAGPTLAWHGSSLACMVSFLLGIAQ